MSQTVIVTTREDLTAIIAEIMGQARQDIPQEASELERLKRKALLTPDEVEKLYGFNARTLANKRGVGLGPEYIQEVAGGPVYYTHKAIEEYLTFCRKRTHG